MKDRIRQSLHLKRALAIVWRSGPGWVILSGALILVQGLLPILTLYLIKLVVDQVTFVLSKTGGKVSFGHIALLIALMGAAALVTAICRTLSAMVREAQSQAVTDYVHQILHAKSVAVDLEYYEDSRYFDTLHRAQEDAPFRPTRIVNSLAGIFQNGVSLLGIAGLLLSLHWAVVAVLFVAALPGLAVRMRYAREMYRWQRRRTPLTRYAHYFHYLLTRDVNAKEIRLFNLGAHLQKRFRDLRRRLRLEWLKIAKRRTIADSVTQSSFTLAVFGSFAFIAYRAVHGLITIGDLVMYFQAVQRGQTYLQQTLSGLAGLYEDNLFLSNLSEFLDLETRVKEPARPKAVPKPIRDGIRFEKVGFRYPTGTREVLTDIDLHIAPREHIALVGVNGSGKTTLVKLLCRLYDPTEGRISIDGIDLREFETTALRREIGVILQNFVRYHLTAGENIGFGDIERGGGGGGNGGGEANGGGVNGDGEGNGGGEANGDSEGRLDGKGSGRLYVEAGDLVRAAAMRSGIHDLIETLPRRYETILGKWFENGEELSIGEWQKVALARAYLRDAQILVLDEPTSSMDARAEHEVLERFGEFTRDTTTILISHRLSTARMADRIVVLDQGRIAEIGTHDQLVNGKGRYRELFETQAGNYR